MKKKTERHASGHEEEARFQNMQQSFSQSEVSSPMSIAISHVTQLFESPGANELVNIQWLGGERRWRCRLLSGPFAGIEIEVVSQGMSAIEMSLFPCDNHMHQELLLILPDIKYALQGCNINKIRIVNVFNSAG